MNDAPIAIKGAPSIAYERAENSFTIFSRESLFPLGMMPNTED